MIKRYASSYSEKLSPIKVIPLELSNGKAELKVFHKSGSTYFLTIEFPHIPEENFPEFKESYSLEKLVKDDISQESEFECEEISEDYMEKNMRIGVNRDEYRISFGIKLPPLSGFVSFSMTYFDQNQ